MFSKKSISFGIVVLMILPIVMVAPIVTSTFSPTLPVAKNPVQQTHTAGARLAEYTTHVPIIIDETQDFITQGWPGSGTDVDPFLIYGLNITYDIGLVEINITNTDAYFKIVDCVVNQQTNALAAIYFENVSHAIVEYSTVTSKYTGINLNNATNTLISYVDVTNDQGNSVTLTESDYVTISNGVFSTSSGRAVHVTTANYLTIDNVIFDGSTSYHAIYASNANSTTIHHFVVTTALDFIQIGSSHDLIITDSSASDVIKGIIVTDVNNVQIESTDIDANTYGIYIGGTLSYDFLIEGCYIYSNNYGVYSLFNLTHVTINNNIFSGSTTGISLYTFKDSIITNNEFRDMQGGTAVALEQGEDVVFTHNRVATTDTGTGLALQQIVNVSVQNNNFNNVQAEAILAFKANDSIVAYNTFTNTDTGIDAEQAHRWDVYSNDFAISNSAITVYNSSFFNVSYNTASGGNSETFYFDKMGGDLSVVGNSISDSDDFAIYVSDIDAPLVENNTLNHVYTGIYVSQAPNCTIRLNQIMDAEYTGITTWEVQDGKFLNNTIGEGPTKGIELVQAKGATIFGNDMTSCGFFIPLDMTIDPYIFDMTYNTVNGLPVYYALNKDGLNINGQDYGQIFVVNSTQVLIQNGSFIKPSLGIGIFFSDFVTVDNVFIETQVDGIAVAHSDNSTITDVAIHGITGSYGINFRYSYNNTSSNVAISGFDSNSAVALRLYFGNRFLLTNLSLESSFHGIYAIGTDNVTLTHTVVRDMSAYGLRFISSPYYWTIQNDQFINCRYGIFIGTGAQHMLVDESKFLYNSQGGIYSYLSTADYNNVTNSYFEGNSNGIYTTNCDYWAIIGNTFAWNVHQGVTISGMTDPVIYGNTFFGNREENGHDPNNHYWDDGVGVGNAWDDYDGSGVYNIPGGLSQDRYPSLYLPTTPIISSPIDIQYAEGTEHYLLTWYAYDDYLASWEASIDGSSLDSGAWNFDNVTVDVGGLTYGTHTVTVIIFDIDGNNATDTVLVHVYDDTAPNIAGPYTVIAFAGGSGQILTWNASDLHPANYSLYVDNSLLFEDVWTTGTITYDVSGLAVGDHVVLLVVRDIGLNQASDTVQVRIISDTTAPTINSPSDMTIYAGSTGNVILWNPSDLYPERYEITLNGSLLVSEDWNGGAILLNLDGFDVGVYQFAITVYDGAGNSVSDSVTVNVITAPWSTAFTTTTTTTPPAPLDATLAIIILAGAAGAVVIIAVLYFLKKRRI